MENNLLKILLIGVFLMVSNTYSQSVSGVVTGDNGIPVPGVNVIVKGTNNGASTDFDGQYIISDVPENGTLVFSYLGFQTQEIQVAGRKTINVSLQPDTQSLDEVVILGYGQVQNKKTITTAVSTISSNQIEELPIQRAEAALQGTAPGVVVAQTSGSPGSPLTVRIRGVGSPNSSQPLYIVDGLQVPNLEYLNPNDIGKISILKDAASAAIYGSRGGNGVVLVETVKGKRGRSKPDITIKGFYGFQSLGNKPDLMNKDQYIDYYNAGVAAAGANLAEGFRGTFSDEERALLPDTDWYDVLFNDAPIQDVYVSLKDGTEQIAYSVSGGFFDQEGIVGGEGKSEFNRRNIRGSLNADITKNLSVDLTADYQSVQRYFLSENNGGPGNALMNFITALPPIYPVFAEDGEIFNPGRQNPNPTFQGVPLNVLGAVTNPIWSIAIQNNEAVQDISVLGGALNWEPIENLNLRATYSSFNLSALNRGFVPTLSIPSQIFNSGPFGNYSEFTTDFIRRQWGGTAEYLFGNLIEKGHNLKVLAGYEVVENELIAGDTVTDAGEFLTNNFDDVNFSLSTDITDALVTPGFVQEVGLVSYFGKVDYNLNEKYLLSATIRNDRSSNFGENNRSGWFPSASAGWVISEENFLQNSNVISLLKLRASWGISGNDASPRALAFQSSVNTGAGYGGEQGVVLTGLANPDLKWEELEQINVGLDLNAFGNSLGLTVEYYDKETSDILLAANTPLTSGLNPSVVNVGSVKNSGFEVLLSYRDTYKNGFSWNASVNVGFNENEVTDLGADGQAIGGGFTAPLFADNITLTAVGEPISSFYGFQVEGIDAAGNLLFADLDNSGNDKTTPNAEDKTFIGDPFPDYTYGISFGASYKGFDFSTFLFGTQGNDIFDATIRYDAIGSNRPVAYTEVGAPRNLAATSLTNGENLVSDFHVKDGSFLKVKNVSLGYSLPESAISAIGAEKVRIYISGQNLLTFTDYDGVDPEIGENFINSSLDIGIDRGFYPQPRQFLLGFEFNF
ncbi:TonB-dependent receptor [Aquimarina gracilis]|uniref:TonB-dependent receptor n=1 Tax=Aquimarina gracilis TaxID=874422 RepID=A0ABU5ZS83_9FLAO|nr:TonB-dependent receptor [Aquimarina gracilis]MEB3344798.1 TonB-dependent receptor [Aquimarina gracilis]